MRIDRRRLEIGRSASRVGWLAAAVAVVFSGGCTTIIGAAVSAVTGEEMPESRPPPLPPPRQPQFTEAPRSDYLWGPVPGWDQYALRIHPFQIPPSLFQADLFAGACPGLRLARGESDDPFGATHLRADFQFFDLAPSHAADINYYQPGRVTLVGLTDPFPTAAFARIPAYGSGACTSIGIPLITFGTPLQYRVLRE